MRTICGKLVCWMGALALIFIMAPSALGQCGLFTKSIKPTGWLPQYGGTHQTLVRTALDDNNEQERSIVGMWHVIFTAKTLNGAPIADTVIDNALVVWHSDHTEIMNSGRPPQDGNFCMGVWEQVGKSKYKLNHFSVGNDADPNAPPGTVGPPSAGPAHLTEAVTLSRDGNHFSGTFTLDAPDTNNVVTSFTGAVTATRITMHTTPGDL